MPDYVELRLRGRDTLVPSVIIADRNVIVTGRLVKVARVMDEELVQGEIVPDPGSFTDALKETALKADLFVFAEKPPQLDRRFPYASETDNWAVIELTTFDDWWTGLPQATRKNVRRAEKKGIEVKQVDFTDDLVAGIKAIYDESPIRQGRRFWHYRKDLAYVRKMNSTYNDRAEFYGAYLDGALIGFIKLIFTDHVGSLIQILAMDSQSDKRPMNALLAEAVNACLRRGSTYLSYGNYDYQTNSSSSLAEFKRRNGFVKVEFPRYFIPLTTKGKQAFRLGYRNSVRDLVPRGIIERYVKIRAMVLSNRR
jgi:hypothetical protein